MAEKAQLNEGRDRNQPLASNRPAATTNQTIVKAFLGVALIFGLYVWNAGSLPWEPPATQLTGAAKVLHENPLIDGHNGK